MPDPSEGHPYRYRTQHGPGHRETGDRDRTCDTDETTQSASQSIDASTVNGTSIEAMFTVGSYESRTNMTTL